MKFYTVSDHFTSYLKGLDPNVQNNYGGGKTYIGIVLEIDSIKYIAPLTSYKPKQDKIRSDSPLSFKLHERGRPNNKLGMIQLNNMIPVIDSEISLLDIESQPGKYKRMLYKQYEFIKTKATDICDRADKLHTIVCEKSNPFFNRMCCNFKLLEESLSEYKK
jgi:protein AbiQ